MRPADVEIQLVVYDLLPKGRLSEAAWWTGLGLYHSAIRVPELDLEFAFGGHPNKDQTGIFYVPAGETLPGCRLRRVIPLGKAFGRDWRLSRDLLAAKEKVEDNSATAESSHQLLQNAASISGNTESQTQKHDSDILSKYPDNVSKEERKDLTLSCIIDIVDGMKQDSDWSGPSYDLLHRNCNTFSEILAFALTGRRTPSWLNRAAWVGSNIPCLVPMVIEAPPTDLEEVGEIAETPQPSVPTLK